MNKWYQSAPCKGVLIILEHMLAAVMAVCLIWTLSYPAGGIRSAIVDKPKKSYAESKGFEEQLQTIAGSVIWTEPLRENFQTEGVYDENKIVDIKEYMDNKTISGENKSGLAYTLGEMMKWVQQGDYSDGEEKIIVCQKPDDSYYYYYMKEFREKVEAGELIFSKLDVAEQQYSVKSQSEMVDALIGGWFDRALFTEIMDSADNKVYESCWVYDGYRINEVVPPQGADNILEILNSNKEWNGKLEQAMSDISAAASEIADEYSRCEYAASQWSEGNTNVAYLLVDLDNNKIYTNRTAYQNPSEWEKNIASMKKMGKYAVVTPKLADFKSNMDSSAERWKQIVGANISMDNYVCAIAVDTDYPIQDQFYQENKIYEKYAPTVRGIFILGVVSGIMLLFILLWLTVISGHSNKQEGISLNLIDGMKTEIFLALSGGLFGLAVFGSYQILSGIFAGSYRGSILTDVVSYGTTAVLEDARTLDVSELALVGAAAVGLCAAGLILWLGVTRRMKAGTLWSNSIIKWMVEFIKNTLKNMSIIWKAALGFAGFVAIHWIAMAVWDPGIWFTLMVLTEGAAFIYLIRSAIGKSRIKKGIASIANGEVEYQIPVDGLKGELLEIAVNINQIGDGLDRALEESMKNERLKTDLITNVSHDIKTPLTSIINYIDLLKRENFEDPKVQNYLKVLEEKAQRLKTLTEDVVEASKVSSGNVNLEMMNLNLAELINQTSGEFEEKFEERDLKFVLNIKAENAVVYADGRRLWRVFANVFNNAAKYAMEHSRIYADLYEEGQEIVFSMKNVSEQPLNITADELTERFIRGDISRSTEGSGLGLSIAKNLTQLQGGKFELYLDGDLFKVMIRFPKVSVGEEMETE